MTRTATLLVGMAVVLGCRSKSPPPEKQTQAPAEKTPPADPAAAPSEEISPRLLRRFQPVAGSVTAIPVDPNKVVLGRALFYEKRLSRTGEIACSSCHTLTKFGIDGQKTSTGVDGKHGARNAPTVFNASTHIAQFWDGRAGSIEAQAAGPIMNPAEMAMPSEKAVVSVLQKIPVYVEMFRKAFPADRDPISLANVGAALGAFERGLVTTSRWDRFIAGDTAALSAKEKHGLKVFLDAGCMTCHTGPQVGGTMFQKVGALVAWPNQKDEGRRGVTKSDADKMVFKVPSLKNIAQTAPYFHDGATASLEEAIRMMGHHQLGIDLPDDDVEAIAIWMRSMTGEIDPDYIRPPEMPSGRSG